MTGPCLACGQVRDLGPGRLNGFPVYCAECTPVFPKAIGAVKERRLSAVDLDARGVTNIAGYKRRNGHR